MNQSIEQQINERANKAPRVTQADIDAAITGGRTATFRIPRSVTTAGQRSSRH